MISNIYLIYISVEINNRNRLMSSMLEFLKITEKLTKSLINLKNQED